MSAALLEARMLRISVPGRVLVDEFACAVGPGDFCVLLGGNGAGKSLLLRTLAGLRAPSAGQVLLDGRDIREIGRRDVAVRLGFLPQDPESAPQGTLRDAVMLGRFAHLGFWEMPGTSDDARVNHALGDTGLAPLAAREVGTLSGGEQRRAAIARLLVQSPALYLLDEPTNHLDPAQQLGILERLRALAREGSAVLASLHDPNLALRFATRVFLMFGDGRVETVEGAALDALHLEQLYGVRYFEMRAGGQRFMAPG